MTAATALFVSKRLQILTAAFFCLMALQLVLAGLTRDVAPYPVSARVAISR